MSFPICFGNNDNGEKGHFFSLNKKENKVLQKYPSTEFKKKSSQCPVIIIPWMMNWKGCGKLKLIMYKQFLVGIVHERK